MYRYVLIYAYVHAHVCTLYEQESGGGATRATIQAPTSVAAATICMYIHVYVYVYIYICIYMC